MGRHRQPALYRPVRVLILGLALLASLCGLLVAAVGEALCRDQYGWAAFFALLTLADLAAYWYVTDGLAQYLVARRVDRRTPRHARQRG